MERKTGTVYLIPTPISDEEDALKHLPEYNREILKKIRYFVVENTRSARRFISKCRTGVTIDELHFAELNEHTDPKEVERLLEPVLRGEDCGILSEAGAPAVADPGADLVAAAHRRDVRVVPLAGPSSILLSLMASGMNGQSFAFNGYLPVKSDARAKRIRELARTAQQHRQSQIFIEAPYRNEQLVRTLLDTLPENTRLTIAVNITASDESIRTKTIGEWRRTDPGTWGIRKNTAIFILG